MVVSTKSSYMNDNETLIPENGFSFNLLLKKIVFHFKYGDTPSDFSQSNISLNPRLLGLQFDCHPGPVKDVIEDASNLHKMVLIYVYFYENEICRHTDSLFQQPSIIREIQRSFIFYPVNATSYEGYSIATRFKFNKMPLFLILKPNGASLNDSSVYLSHEGFISENALLSYITIENQNDIRQEQDQAFLDAVAEAEQNNMRIEEIENQVREEEAKKEQERELIEQQFNNLPKVDVDDNTYHTSFSHNEKTCYIARFHFPDNAERTHVFPLDGTLKMLYIFARYYMHPNEFTLNTLYPSTVIPETDEPISKVSQSSQFVIFVNEL